MKTTLTKTNFKPAIERTCQLFGRVAYLAAAILICATTSGQNLFVSGTGLSSVGDAGGEIFRFTWDGSQSIFASGLTDPWDVAFDSAGNLFVIDYDRSGLLGDAAIYKITPHGVRIRFASGLTYPSYLAVDSAGNVFVADYNHGTVYKYKPTGSHGTFASGLHHPVGMAFNSLGNLFVVDNSAGNISLGKIYEYKPNGSRSTFTVLDASDHPADLAFDSMGHLLMADLGGKIYRYASNGALPRNGRTIFGSVPGSAQSLAFDSAGNLLVVDAGGVSSAGVIPNAIYKFTLQGARSTFASGQALSETFACLAFQPIPCCE
jgi:DNA-binding beta-propeller fold protein YncE